VFVIPLHDDKFFQQICNCWHLLFAVTVVWPTGTPFECQLEVNTLWSTLILIKMCGRAVNWQCNVSNISVSLQEEVRHSAHTVVSLTLQSFKLFKAALCSKVTIVVSVAVQDVVTSYKCTQIKHASFKLQNSIYIFH
jgi:hypothetical protein